MKLYGSIAVHVKGEEILRTPRFWDKFKRAFGAKPDLRTGHMRASIEATAIVEAVRDALRQIGVSNAVSLVVDDTVLYHDREGTPDDLGDLFLAFHDNSSVFGEGFDELRLAVEHREAGLHTVIELQARSEHPRDRPAIRIVLSGRIQALTPLPGEDAEAFRKRAEPVATDVKALEVYRAQFATFVDRVRDAIAGAMPTARVEVEVAEPRIVRPDAKAAEPRAQNPDDRGYDPFLYYYPSPLAYAADALMWTALFSAMHQPHYVVVDQANHVQGFADEPAIQDGPTSSAESAAADADAGDWWGDNDAGSGSDAGETGDFGDGDLGGGFDGGDFGGGDFGGGDFGDF